MRFCEQLDALMDEKCETNYALAKAIGASQSTVANWRNGKTIPAIRYVGKLAEHFGVPVSQMRKMRSS